MYYQISTRGTSSNPKEDFVPRVEFTYLVFTRMPGENYCRQLKSVVVARQVMSFKH